MTLAVAVVTILASVWTQAAALLVLCFWAWWRANTPSDRSRADWFTAAAAFSLPANLLFHAAAGSMSALRPLKLDAYAYALDGLLGQPAFAVGRLLHALPALSLISATAYDLLPMATLAAFGVTVWLRPNETKAVAISIMASMFLLPLFYLALPVCGPVYAFPSFPNLPGPLLTVPMALSAAPNGMPSGHFAGALIFAYCFRRWRAGRVAGAIFVALTLLSTLGLGEHYAVDLIAAIPYTVFVLWLGKRCSETATMAPVRPLAAVELAA